MKELKNIKYFIFDLDGTCYLQLEEVFGQVSKKMGQYISKKLNVNLKKAKEWLNSPEYAEVAKIRLENSVGTFVLLEGF